MAEAKAPVVGMVGAGQLARMTYQGAIPLGLTLRILAARPDDGAALVSAETMVGSPDDLEALKRFAETCDIVTFDHELVPPAHLEALEAEGHVLRPSAATQRFAQDKWYQRSTFAALGLPVPPHAKVGNAADAEAFATRNGWPLVLKAVRGGYDGRGVWVVDSPEDAGRVVHDAAAAGIELMAEAFVPIDKELAVMVARRPSGETAVYPLVETVQVDGMCREVLAPAGVPGEVAAEARSLALRIADTVGLSGVLAVELFMAHRELMINEIATRPHNSGHYSIEGCVTSQFENHLRGVLDWPLGDTALTAPAVATVNVVGEAGDPIENLPRALEVRGAHVHLYGKGFRPGRKLGHVTTLGSDAKETLGRARQAASALTAASSMAAAR